MKFYLYMECHRCEADMHYGPVATNLAHDGLPVVPVDLASQEQFTCDACGAEHYTGDLDVVVETDDEGSTTDA